MNPFPEHRRYARFPIAYEVKLIVEDRIIAYPMAIDLSLGGIRLDGGGNGLAVGTACGVAILLEDGRNVVARGVVVRVDAQGVAIDFSKALEAASERALLGLLQSLGPGTLAPGRAASDPEAALDGSGQNG